MKAFKRNAIILTVLLFVCAAIYLNWSYNNSEDVADVTLNNSETNQETKTEENGDDKGENVTTGEESSDDTDLYYEDGSMSESSSEYFSMTRLNRQQARDEATETLKAVSEDEGASQETIDSALDKIAVMASYTVTETELEALLLQPAKRGEGAGLG